MSSILAQLKAVLKLFQTYKLTYKNALPTV
jgi:hypothetical protein